MVSAEVKRANSDKAESGIEAIEAGGFKLCSEEGDKKETKSSCCPADCVLLVG